MTPRALVVVALLLVGGDALAWPIMPAAPAPPIAPAAAPGAAPAPPVAPAAAPVPAPPPSANKLAEARLHFQQGVALYKEQNYDAALAEFLGAYAISGEPVVLYNLGLTYKALFRYAESVDTLERYLTESGARGQTITKARRAEVEKLAAEMRSLLADVTLIVKPADAALRIDGRPVTLGIEGIVKLSAGSHSLEASASDYTAARRDITVVAGTPQSVALTLAAIPRTGHVRITAVEIGARVAVDGRDLGPAPVELDLLAGGHQVELDAPGFAPTRSELLVAAGQSRAVSMTLDRTAETRPIYRHWWFWVGAGVVAAAVTTTLLLYHQPTEGPLPGTLGNARTDP